jgi:protein-disulfide isomerase
MSTSLTNIFVITGLSTALAVGAYKHFEIVEGLQQQIDDFYLAEPTPDEVKEMWDSIASMMQYDAPSQEEREVPDNWIYGSLSARFTLVEMTDTECPYCSKHFPILKSLVDTSGGNINAALLHVPAISEASRQQALAVECAGEQGGSESAWKYIQLVFDNTEGNGRGVTKSLGALAGELGLDRERFTACLDSTAVIDRVTADMRQAIELNIKQTPSTMVIDNTTGNSMVLQGANASHEGILEAMSKVSSGATQ